MARFDYNPQIVDVVVRSPQVADLLRDKAAKVADEARRNAPVGRYPGGGRYREGIEPEVGLEPDGLLGRVNARHFTSHWIEFGTVRLPARAPLRTALESVMGHIARIEGGRR